MRRAAKALACLLLAGPAQAGAAPGDLIAAVEIAPAPASARAWRIRYETTDAAGRATESTGVVIAPAGNGLRPVLAWAHGTIGVAPACARSVLDPFGHIPGLDAMLARGWTVVATDYPGLGTPGPHDYLGGQPAGRAVLDSVRAARGLELAGAGPRFAVWGHSQGGHAGLWAGQLARPYAPELTLVGVAAAAPPTDLAANWAAMNKGKRAGLTALLAASWSETHGLNLSDLGDPKTQAAIREVGSHCLGEPAALRAKVATGRVRTRLRNVDPGSLAPWREVMDRNRVGDMPAGAPLLITQGPADDVVSPEVTRAFVSQACRRGETVRYASFGGGHAAPVEEGAAMTLEWLAARFAGLAPESSC